MFEESFAVTGALQAFAAFSNVAQSALLEVFHAFEADFFAELNADQAFLVASRTAVAVVPVYACARAVDLVVYASEIALLYFEKSAEIEASRADTADPRHAIFEATLASVEVEAADADEAKAKLNKRAVITIFLFMFLNYLICRYFTKDSKKAINYEERII